MRAPDDQRGAVVDRAAAQRDRGVPLVVVQSGAALATGLASVRPTHVVVDLRNDPGPEVDRALGGRTRDVEVTWATGDDELLAVLERAG